MTTKEQIISLFGKLQENERISLLDELIQSKPSDTLLVEEVPILSCPHCDSKLFVKNGLRNGLQKYKCKSCCKIFTSRTGTAYHKIQKLAKFETYKVLMTEDYMSIKKIAKRVGISVQTAFDWRHKILSGVTSNECEFDGITEIDDIWVLYSQKGRKGLDYSRKRGGSKRSGDNDFQAKLLITSDRKKNMDMSLVRIGRLKKSDIQRKISGKFLEGCILVSDKHRSIASFAKSEKLEHKSFKAKEHTAGGEFHVQSVNNMAARLKAMINHNLRGVSTKYLQSYANWFKLNVAKTPINEITNNSKVSDIHKNRESIYKKFIEHFSRRTYRCPVKRTFKTELHDKITNLGYI